MQQALVRRGVRAAGSSHGDHHHHHFEESKNLNAKFQIPTQHDVDYQLPKKAMFNEKFSMWIQSRWPVDRDDLLNNDRPNKRAAYYWF